MRPDGHRDRLASALGAADPGLLVILLGVVVVVLAAAGVLAFATGVLP